MRIIRWALSLAAIVALTNASVASPSQWDGGLSAERSPESTSHLAAIDQTAQSEVSEKVVDRLADGSFVSATDEEILSNIVASIEDAVSAQRLVLLNHEDESSFPGLLVYIPENSDSEVLADLAVPARRFLVGDEDLSDVDHTGSSAALEGSPDIAEAEMAQDGHEDR